MPPRQQNKLTNVAIKALKHKDKPYKVSDGGGLYLLIGDATKNSKLWRMKYYFQGKEKLLSFGDWPDVTLAEAREERDKAKKLIKEGIDPGVHKKKASLEDAPAYQFETIAREWWRKQLRGGKWGEKHAANIEQRLERYVFAFMGKADIRELNPKDILDVIRKIENANHMELAHKVFGYCSNIFRYAVACAIIPSDPSRDLIGALTPSKSKNMAAIIDPAQVGKLLLAVDNYSGSAIVRYATQFSFLTFARPGEIRHAEWTEIDYAKRQWIIPAHKMKMKEIHYVPLVTQTLRLLERIHAISGKNKYLFPAKGNPNNPMSENAVRLAFRKMGYSADEMTAHGIRSIASTSLNNLGENRDHVEAQLAHKEKDKVRDAYNFADYMKQRHQMMQRWADYLDKLREQAKPTNIKIGAIAINKGNSQIHNSITNPGPLAAMADTYAKLDALKARLKAFRPISPEILANLKQDMVVRYTYNSNAIEGNTLTLHETKAVLENGITIGGKSMREHLEAINHRDAIEYLESLVTENQPLTPYILKELHQLILKGINDNAAGTYRKQNVVISGASFTPPDALHIEELLAGFFDWYNSAAKTLHPLERAARVHADFVNIHPFIDGNGRTARLIMNLELMRDGFPTLIIPVEERSAYYAHLDAIATQGNYEPLVKQLTLLAEKSFQPYWFVLGVQGAK